jgi:hypothetical protein
MASCDGTVNRLGDGRGGAGAVGGKAGVGGFGGAAGCPHAAIAASEVLWIGDSWLFTPTGVLHNAVRDRARASGAIGPSEDYSSRAEAGKTMAQIAAQYSAQQAGVTKVKVVLMDGGTWDTYTAGASDSVVNGVVDAFIQFLAQAASDGTVQHVVYFLPPELSMIPGVTALRPKMLQACSLSVVPCHFIDLQAVWNLHPGETLDNSLFPNDAGARLIADAIWSQMQQNCIAQ